MATGTRKRSRPRPTGTKKLYHYTSEEGSVGIDRDKRITASTNAKKRNAVFGPGVYLTSKSPTDNTKFGIMLNNYDSTFRNMERRIFTNNAKKIEKVIEVNVPKRSVEHVHVSNADRDIYRIKGDLDLNRCTYRILDGPADLL